MKKYTYYAIPWYDESRFISVTRRQLLADISKVLAKSKLDRTVIIVQRILNKKVV